MIGFEISVNGKRLCTAGVGDHGVLTAILSWVRRKGEHTRDKRPHSSEEELTLEVGGLITPRQEHVRWQRHPVRVGDEIHLKIVQVSTVDKPRFKVRSDATRDLRAQKDYVRQMAKRFGWEIRKRAKP